MKKSKDKKVVQNKNVRAIENKNIKTKLNEFKVKDSYIIIFFAVITFLFFREILLQQKFLWLDFVEAYYPWRNFAAVILSQGTLPHWNPYTFGGMPFIADIQTSVFYPLHLLLTVFVTENKLPFVASEYLLVFHYFMAGVFSYYLARSLYLNKWASILSGITFMFCSFMVTHAIHETIITQVAYMPLIFMFYNKVLNTSRPYDNLNLKSIPDFIPDKSGSVIYPYCLIDGVNSASQTELNKNEIIEPPTNKLKYILLTGLFMGIVILCGHPQITLYMFFTFLLFGLYQIFFKFKENNCKIDVALFRFIAIAAIPFIIGVMLGAIQLLPTMTLSELSERAEMSYEQSSLESLNYHDLFTLFSPKFFGSYGAINHGLFYWGHENYGLYVENCIYVGLLALVFGIFAIVSLWKKKIVKFLAGISLLSIFLILGDNFIFHKLFYDFVPGFNLFHYIGRFLLIFAFAFSLLGANGFDYFINNDEEKKVKKFIKCFIVLISSFILLWLLYIGGIFENLFDAYKYKVVYGDKVDPRLLYENSTSQIAITIIILLVLFGLVILYKKKIILQQVILLLFILLSFVDLYIFGSQQNNDTLGPIPGWPSSNQTLLAKNHNIPLGPEAYYRNQGIADRIKQDYDKELFRIIGMIDYRKRIFGYNQGMLDFIFLLDGYTPLAIKDRFPPFRTDELMNVKYVAVIDTTSKMLRFIVNKGYAPRIWMSYYPIVESSLEKVAKILEDTTFDIARKVIIDQEPEIYINKAFMGEGTARNQIMFKSYDINKITLSVETSENGILVLSEVYYPNWKVFVDGVEKPILRCDYSLRGVALEKGNHAVVFKYVDKDFQLGTVITLFALAIVIGGFIADRYKTNKVVW
jgi:hypothetical protein